MHLQVSATRICHVAAIVLVFVTAFLVAGYSQSPAPPVNIDAFFHDITGEWIGTVEQYTGNVKADTKYFHSVAKQTGLDTYEAVFEYYRIDEKTHAPVQVGVTRMTNRITPDGTATNAIAGEGDVFVDPKTSRHEKHTLSEVLRMSPSGSLEGKGSGKISIGGLALGAGRNGKVSAYTSTWTLSNGILRISERFRVTFKVLFFAQHYDIIYNFEGRRGSDITGLMKRAGSSADPAATATDH